MDSIENSIVDISDTNIKPFKCSYCAKCFNHGHHLRRHTKTHLLQNICGICNAAYSRKKQLKKHMLKHKIEDEQQSNAYENANNESNTYKCPHVNCSSTFDSFDSLYRHIQRMANRKRQYECEVCSFVFHCFSDLVKHRRQIHPTKIHICQECGKGYTRKHRLSNHIKLRHGSIDQDNISTDAFDTSIDLKANNTCQHCGLGFSTKSNLRVHIRVKHFNEKQFSCETCGLKFSYKSVLKRHINIFHIDKSKNGTDEFLKHVDDSTPSTVASNIEHVSPQTSSTKYIVDAVSLNLIAV